MAADPAPRLRAGPCLSGRRTLKRPASSLQHLLTVFAAAFAGAFAGLISLAQPTNLTDQFELPPGFHIYRAATAELSGGSYDLCFDGEGRLLVGDGTAVRRLLDRDNDGVYDGYEVIATGLGPRGPQGLLVWGDRLYAVGGDGLQLFEGYRSGQLVHRGRLGAKFNTGGDHDLHTVLRGHDGYLYLMAGNGAGIEGRRHITELTSPCLFEREASVFRVSPDGQKWECIARGGRNPPNLGMNYLGELFSWDSDMEWHVGLPWYRPTRLNHWVIGGDQGWHDVGALPPYYLDTVPPVLETGRASPNWGVFYEHTQLPEKYRDAFLVCDYRWKSASRDECSTTGRLVAFFLKRDGASWKATMETLAKPKPGARDATGKPINFALVDVEVAPDGSLYLSDHNQGVWRIYYTKKKIPPATPADVATAVLKAPLFRDSKMLRGEALTLPQPSSECSRRREETIRSLMGTESQTRLEKLVLDQSQSLRRRLRALLVLASDFSELRHGFLNRMSRDPAPEVRAQAAWLCGLRDDDPGRVPLLRLVNDPDPFVRRRALEAFSRLPATLLESRRDERMRKLLGDSIPEGRSDSLGGVWSKELEPRGEAPLGTEFLRHLTEPNRQSQYTAMMTLSRVQPARWLWQATTDIHEQPPQVRMRWLTASLLRQEPEGKKTITSLTESLLDARGLTPEDRLDLLRLLALFREPLSATPQMTARISRLLLARFPDADRGLRFEQIRLLGDYRVTEAFPKLLDQLEAERDEVTQFHIAQAISRLPSGWTPEQEQRLLRWMLGTQRGWFAQFEDKGFEFPMFFSTVLADFGKHHREALLRNINSEIRNPKSEIQWASLLGTTALELLAEAPDADQKLLALYRANASADVKLKLLRALRKVPQPTVAAFLRDEFARHTEPAFRGAILVSLAAQPPEPANVPLLLEGLRLEDIDFVNACASALIKLRPALDEDLANLLLSRLHERRRFLPPTEKLLTALSGATRPGFNPDAEPWRRIEDESYTAARGFWNRWYEQRFEKKFEPRFTKADEEKSDEEIYRFILSDASRGGDPVRGRKVYERVQCNTCHAGGAMPGQEGRLFGPDLAGVTQRLTRVELVDALVYPSKQVADRFKAVLIELKDGEALTGFLTDQDTDTVTLADREQVHRVPRSKVVSISPQSTSLMPERQLNQLSFEEIRDLLSALDAGATSNATANADKR